jgi:Pyridine nucleotide-disulphide oxidoreductase
MRPGDRCVVIGAGPMGIAAAIGAADRGCEVTVLERGRIGASLRTWGATRFFSPLHMNVSPRMRELLDGDMPDPDALLAGAEYAERVLVPLTEREPLRGRVKTGCNVIAIGRRGLTRSDYAGHPLRAERPFRVLCGDEQTFDAEVVLDASGGLTVPRPIGIGGLPAIGESRLARRPIRTLGDLAAQRDAIRGRRILVLGDGHSAANAIGLLDEVAREAPETRVIWAVRAANRRPCEEVPNDPLPERRAVVERANALAETPPPFLTVERKAMIERVAQNNGHAVVTLTGNRDVDADFIAAFTGYRPDGAFLSELAVEISPVTEGGARLYRAISCITDCLSVPKVKPDDLASGEPGFWFVGSRAYGRSRTFLLQTGFSQLEVVLASLGVSESQSRRVSETAHPSSPLRL